MFFQSLSGVHLDNQIVGSVIDITANKVYTRVGSGIFMNKTSYPYEFIVTFDFTLMDLILNPPDPVQLEKFRQSVVKAIIEKNPNIRSENKQLSADINTWFTQNNVYSSEDLEFFLSKKWGGEKQIKVWTRDVFYYQLQIQNIRDDQNLDNKEGTQIGLGLVVNRESKSIMSAFIVFI